MFVRAAPLWGVGLAVVAIVVLVSALYLLALAGPLRRVRRRAVGPGRAVRARRRSPAVHRRVSSSQSKWHPDREGRRLRFATPVIVTLRAVRHELAAGRRSAPIRTRFLRHRR